MDVPTINDGVLDFSNFSKPIEPKIHSELKRLGFDMDRKFDYEDKMKTTRRLYIENGCTFEGTLYPNGLTFSEWSKNFPAPPYYEIFKDWEGNVIPMLRALVRYDTKDWSVTIHDNYRGKTITLKEQELSEIKEIVYFHPEEFDRYSVNTKEQS